MKIINRFLQVFSFFFPGVCRSCGRITDYNMDVCKSCEQKLFPIKSEKACPNCGIEKPNCDCNSHIYYFEGIACAYYNTDTAQNIMYRYKLGKKSYYSKYIAGEMVKTLKEKFGDIKFDYLLAVPSSFVGTFLSGYDHSGILAKDISDITGIPLKRNVIGCKNFKKSQHTSSYKQRFCNVSGKYYVKKIIHADNVLLIDDIKTTGATLNACARELLYSKAKKVYCLTYLASGRNIGKMEPAKKV